MADKASRYPDNVPGPFYVDDQCSDCDLCRETAPDNFTRNHDGGYSYVFKQPATEKELSECNYVLQACPVEAIGSDGDHILPSEDHAAPQAKAKADKANPYIKDVIPGSAEGVALGSEHDLSRATVADRQVIPVRATRYDENVPGPFYVDDNCICCDLCRESAPKNFKCHDPGGYAYVFKQPTSEEELEQCKEALQSCPTEAIGLDAGYDLYGEDPFDHQAKANKANREPKNALGPFYTDDKCVDCDFCCEVASNNFKRDYEGGYSYIFKQPANEEELEQCQEALEGCPVKAIGSDGDEDLYGEDAASSRSPFVVTDISLEIKKYFAKHPEKTRQLTPRQFEMLVADILRDFGFDTELTRATRDGGRDIYAYVKNAVTSFLLYVECKRWAPERKVGIDIVQRVYGAAKSGGAHKSMIVTTSFFSGPAHEEQKRVSHEMDLRDYTGLKNWLQRYN